MSKVVPQFGTDMLLYGKTKIFLKIPAVNFIENLLAQKVKILLIFLKIFENFLKQLACTKKFDGKENPKKFFPLPTTEKSTKTF